MVKPCPSSICTDYQQCKHFTLPRLDVKLQTFSHLVALSKQSAQPYSTVISRQPPLHYHFTNFSLMWDNNTSYYFPGDLQEAIHEKYRFYFLILKGESMVKVVTRIQKLRTVKLQFMITFLVMMFPSSSVNCSSVTDSPGMFFASSP